MALLDSELDRIKVELGFNALNVGAEPYVGVAAIFSQVIQPYLRSGASTTSSTAVTAASTPTPTTLTLADATGFSQFARAIVDVDGRQEEATVQAVSGSTITVLLSLTHSGSYPVTVEGGESMVRSVLARLRRIATLIDSSADNAGIKVVDEIEFFGDGKSVTAFNALIAQQRHWRSELCRILFGVGDLSQLRSGRGGCRTEMY